LIVEIENLTKVYESKLRVVALDGIDLELKQGEIFGLLGPNGAGKTTTISIATTRTLPTSGRVRIAGSMSFSIRPTRGGSSAWCRNSTRSTAAAVGRGSGKGLLLCHAEHDRRAAGDSHGLLHSPPRRCAPTYTTGFSSRWCCC